MSDCAIDTDVIIRGDDYAYPVNLQVGGVAYNASTSTFAASLRSTVDDATTLGALTVDVTDAATGVLIVRCAAAVTTLLASPKMVWDLEETLAAGGKFTWVQVTCTLRKDATR